MLWQQSIGARTVVLSTLVATCLLSGGTFADEPSAPAPPDLQGLGRVAPAPPDVSQILPNLRPSTIVDPARFGGPRPKIAPKRIPAPRRKSATSAQFVRFQPSNETASSEYRLNLDLADQLILNNFNRARIGRKDLPKWEVNMEQVLTVGDYDEQKFMESTVVRNSLDGEGAATSWSPQSFAWTTPGLYHNPLYFEEVNLERYGHGYRFAQPAASTAHFFGNLAVLPYQMGAYPRYEPIYTLGHHRPGSHNPHQFQWWPFSWRGVAYQTGATIGGAYYLP